MKADEASLHITRRPLDTLCWVPSRLRRVRDCRPPPVALLPFHSPVVAPWTPALVADATPRGSRLACGLVESSACTRGTAAAWSTTPGIVSGASRTRPSPETSRVTTSPGSMLMDCASQCSTTSLLVPLSTQNLGGVAVAITCRLRQEQQ
jgi:hypothetical protein